MCYDIRFLTKKKIKYAQRFGDSEKDIEELEKQLNKIGEKTGPYFHISGFDHPDVPVITGANRNIIQLFNWGLIPPWVKDVRSAVQISNKTLNARSETMFEKPSFKKAAKNNRCLVVVDGFFEHHWKNGKSYPYHIKLRNDEPMALGGIWENWEDSEAGTGRKTFSIVTTKANPLMEEIHNNPKASIGPRMPLIIHREFEEQWLNPVEDKLDKELLEEIMKPYDPDEMEAYTVPRLKGKLAVGNIEKAISHFQYDELESDQGELF